MKIEVPFYGQSWNLESWQSLGYKSYEDAQYWEQSCCGILCTKMVMNGLRPNSINHSIKELIDIGVNQNAYSDESGWTHAGLTEFINKFGFAAKRGNFSEQAIKEIIEAGNLIIVSIKWGFKNTKNFKERILFWRKYGGHLAVVVGFEEINGKITGFYVHHTSKIPEQNWQSRFVPIKTFLKGYTGRGIAVSL